MVMLLFIFTGIVLAVFIAVVFLLGFRLGEPDTERNEVVRVRLQAAEAAHRLHDLTRKAFIAMAEHAAEHGGA